MTEQAPRDRQYDVILFGASGWTGMFVVDEMAKVAQKENLNWAVAGRNREKLRNTLRESGEYTGEDLSKIPVIVADVFQPETLDAMVRQTKVVLNVVGPYAQFGEPVFTACLRANTHHLDISGEIHYLEDMQLKYHEEAKQKGLFMIGSLGLDSVLSDLGVIHTARQFTHGYMTNIESHFLPTAGPLRTSLHTGTMHSIMGVFKSRAKIGEIRRKLFTEPLPEPEYRLPKRKKMYWNKDTQRMTLPFPGTDEAVIERSMRHFLAKGKLAKPVEFLPFYGPGTLYWLIRSIVGFIMFGIFMCFAFTRDLLVKYPEICSGNMFSRYAPTRKQAEATSCNIRFVGYGYKRKEDAVRNKTPNHIVTTRFTAPDPGYVLTAVCCVQACLTVLRDQGKMESSLGGGVWTPAVAFDETSYLDRLASRNVKFQLMSVSDYHQP